jgi:hypothetical protein
MTRGSSNGSHSNWISRSKASGRSGRGASINPQWLKDSLSKMLAVEKGGVKLYARSLSDLQDSEHEDKLNDFLRQTQRHVKLCTEMLRAADDSATTASPVAAYS